MYYPVLQTDCKRTVSTLNGLLNDELVQILEDDEKISNILIGSDQSYLEEIAKDKEKLLTNNGELSEQNLSKEPELIEGREKLEKLGEEFEELKKNVETKSKEYKEKSGDQSLETVLALLQTAASEKEEESDSIAKQLLSNEIDIDNFLEEFLAKRKTMHLRLLKAEKLSKLITNGLGNNSTYTNTPPMNLNRNYFPNVTPTTTAPGGNVPYPTGALNMPMPGMNYFQNHY